MIECAWCSKPHGKCVSAVNRAKKIGAPIYCGRRCAGLGRRSGKTKEQKIEEKRLYDISYREKNIEHLTQNKAEWFQRTYDPIKAAKQRKANMGRHVEYCRQPQYRQYKRQYDQVYRAKNDFGPFFESAMLLQQINNEILSRVTRFDIYSQNRTLNKSQKRRREYEKIVGSKS